MKVLCREDLANHSDPESCAVTREGGREALTGAGVGRVQSSETNYEQVADALQVCGRQHWVTVHARCPQDLRSRRPLARTEAYCAEAGRSHVWPRRMAMRSARGNPKGVIPR